MNNFDYQMIDKDQGMSETYYKDQDLSTKNLYSF